MTEHGRTREIRLRNTARRRGLHLVKSRRRDQLAPDYGKFVLVKDPGQAPAMFAAGKGTNLDEIERLLGQ